MLAGIWVLMASGTWVAAGAAGGPELPWQAASRTRLPLPARVRKPRREMVRARAWWRVASDGERMGDLSRLAPAHSERGEARPPNRLKLR